MEGVESIGSIGGGGGVRAIVQPIHAKIIRKKTTARKAVIWRTKRALSL